MGFAVLQKSLEPPSLDQLKNAFRGVPGLTAVDAHILGRDAFGVLVKGFALDRATALQSALASQGVVTEVVDDGQLPALPPVRHVNRLDCTPAALMISDPLGRSFPLEWRNILLVAAGKVKVDEFEQIRTETRVPTYHMEGGVSYETRIDYRTKEGRHERLLLEIVVSRAALRYSINADQSAHLLFQYLGGRRTRDLGANFAMLVQDLAKGAPEAALNRGAHYLCENAADVFAYPSKNAFYEEITWLLWQLSKSQPGGPG